MHSKISKKAVRSRPIFGPLFFFFLLIVAEDSHMLSERINIFQPTDGLDAHAAGPIPSLVHPQTPHTFTLRARRADENRFEHTVLSFELICMTLSARAESVPDSGGAVEQETIMLCLLNTAALSLTSRCLFLAFVFTSTRSRLKP